MCNPSDEISSGQARRTQPHREATSEKLAKDLAEGAGWKGEEPAIGTRRYTIREAIATELTGDFADERGRVYSRDAFALRLADAVESALLQITIDEEAMERGAEALIGGIERFAPADDDNLPPCTCRDENRPDHAADCARGRAIRERSVKTAKAIEQDVIQPIVAEREEARAMAGEVKDALDRVDAPRAPTLAVRVDRLFRELTDANRSLAKQRDAALEGHLAKRDDAPEADVPARTRALHVVLEDVSDPEGPPGYRFVEIENEVGAGVSFESIRETEPPHFRRIVIPYGRDDAWVAEVAMQCAGAATRPLLEDHPDYVFPAERVRDAVNALLEEFGIGRVCEDCSDERIEHGQAAAKQPADGERDLTKYEARLLEDREQARAGESRLMEQRNAALGLLRWLIGDLIPPYPGFEEED